MKYVVDDNQQCKCKPSSLKSYVKQLILEKKQSSKSKIDPYETYKPKQRGLRCSKEGALFRRIMKANKKRTEKRELKIEAIQAGIFRTKTNKIAINSLKPKTIALDISTDAIENETPVKKLDLRDISTPDERHSTFNLSYRKCSQCDGRVSRNSNDRKM